MQGWGILEFHEKVFFLFGGWGVVCLQNCTFAGSMDLPKRRVWNAPLNKDKGRTMPNGVKRTNAKEYL